MKKHDLPAMPFYWGDWFKAPDVQSLPRDVRCTWFEMLGRMWENRERGYLSINGKKMTDEQLANLLGFCYTSDGAKECHRHISILENSSLFSRDKDGIIYCRRIVEEENLRKMRAKAGKTGMQSRYNKTYNKHHNKSLTVTEDEREDEKESFKRIEMMLFINPKFEKTWREWEDYRRQSRKPLTKISYRKQIIFLSQQPDPIACLNNSMTNGWQGLFEVKDGSNRKSNGQGYKKSGAGGASTDNDVIRTLETARRNTRTAR